METLTGQIKAMLEEREFERLQRPLELICRDRKIRTAFAHLRSQGIKTADAIWQLTDRDWDGEYLSYDAIDQIVYPRRRH